MKMKVIVLLLFISATRVNSKIVIDIETDPNTHNASINYSGIEIAVATNEDINTFFADTNLKQAVNAHYGIKPRNVYFKKPTPWGDLYMNYNWEQVTRVLSIKSARIKSITEKPVVLLSQDFANKASKNPIKVNTGISHTVENTITTSWSKSKEFTVSQEIEYDINVIFAKLAGTTAFSYTTTWGKSQEKTETMTVGSTSAVETELQPGQAVTAELSVNSGYLELEIVYKTSLRGNLAVNFRNAFNGHHFWGPQIQDVMKSAGIENEKTIIENIRFGFHIDAKLQVIDKVSELPL